MPPPKQGKARSIVRAAPPKKEELPWQPPTLAEWLDSVDESARWIIENLIPDDALVIISGQQKRAFKTWFAFLVALSVATGKTFGLLKPQRTGPVLIIEEEGSKAETKGRFLKLCATYGIDPKTLTNIRFSHRERVKLDDKDWRRKLVLLVREMKPALVIYDALTLSHTGDENKQEDMIAVVDSMQAARQQGATFIMLAHLDKARGENPRADIDNQVRGSSVVVNAYDSHLALRRYKMTAAHIDLIARHRGASEHFYSASWDVADPTDQAPQGKAKLSLLEVIEGAKANDGLINKCRAICEASSAPSWSARGLREAWEVSEKTAKLVREALVEEGFLMQQGAAWKVNKSTVEVND